MVHLYPTLEVRKRNYGHLYLKSSLILRVIHCPTPEEKRTDLSLPILNTASYSWSIITPPLEVRKRNPGHLYPKYSLILRVIHCPTLEVKRRDLNLPILNTASYSWSIITPLGAEEGRPRFPYPRTYFLEVLQNRFLYCGVLFGNLDKVGS